ncbi:MAG TPA: zf-HC2 domain-containing protein [Blastocatellia bacterium]|nr:zf-HC2 domain-containing protein [Blastocatellia bacterium]
MNVIDFEQNRCRRIRSQLDSYINNELSVEIKNDVLNHIEGCRECAEALEARARVKNLLQQAVRRDAAPQSLHQRIRKDIRRSSYAWPRWTLAAAAAMVLLVATWGVVRFLNRPAPLSQPTVASVDANAQILKIGLGDHVHCALDKGLAGRRFTFEEMAERIGPDFIGLVPMLKEKMAGFETVVAHSCRYNNREFKHVILKEGERVLSLVITKKNGEGFTHNELTAAINAGGVPVYQAAMMDEARSQQLQVAGFESRDYLVFVVSNAAREEILQIASAIAPAVRDFLAKREI